MFLVIKLKLKLYKYCLNIIYNIDYGKKLVIRGEKILIVVIFVNDRDIFWVVIVVVFVFTVIIELEFRFGISIVYII